MKLGGNLPPNTHLVFDNFFTSVVLMESLYYRGILATGTVRMLRKNLPKELSTRKPKTPGERILANETKLNPGEFTYRFCHPCAVVKWKDTKDVHVLSTAVNPTKVEVIQRTQKNGEKKDMFCPSIIAEYTRSMGGVDHFHSTIIEVRTQLAAGQKCHGSACFGFCSRVLLLTHTFYINTNTKIVKTYTEILDYV
ncbi:unnamed protein product [Parnassius apollo]|uniref:(apollo) hypothetical protein n=1 Tax=Parnassius apollo TaxID=110799 RepID=A0A8S3XFR1_PARAO|nr:unnamed protein product [Parnassius apollo]